MLSKFSMTPKMQEEQREAIAELQFLDQKT